MQKRDFLDITSRFLTKNRSRMESTPIRIPMNNRLELFQKESTKNFASLPRRRKTEKKVFRERKSSTQSDKPRRASSGGDRKLNFGVTSPNGMTENSIRRLRTMRESRADLTSMIKARQAAMLELDSDFDDSIGKVELKHDDGLTKADKTLTSKWCKEINEATVYPCDVCRRIFYHQHALAAHQLLHSGRIKRKATKPKVQCPTCDKFFSSKWKMRFHQATHFNEKNTKVLMVL